METVSYITEDGEIVEIPEFRLYQAGWKSPDVWPLRDLLDGMGMTRSEVIDWVQLRRAGASWQEVYINLPDGHIGRFALGLWKLGYFPQQNAHFLGLIDGKQVLSDIETGQRVRRKCPTIEIFVGIMSQDLFGIHREATRAMWKELQYA